MDFGSHVPLAVLTGRLCAAVGMCEGVRVCVCEMGRRERGQVTSHLSHNTQGKHTNMWLNAGPYLSFQSRVFRLPRSLKDNSMNARF